MRKKLIIISFSFVFFSCNLIEKSSHQKDLGNNFRFIEEDMYRSVIVHCNPKNNCRTSFPVIPSKVEKFKFDEDQIISNSVQHFENTSSYWVINKNFNMDKSNCDNVSCDSILRAHTFGPFDQAEFSEFLAKNSIDLKLDVDQI